MTRPLDDLARQLENENIAQAFDLGVQKEREATVAWLRTVLEPWPPGVLVVKAIELGEHRRTKT